MPLGADCEVFCLTQWRSSRCAEEDVITRSLFACPASEAENAHKTVPLYEDAVVVKWTCVSNPTLYAEKILRPLLSASEEEAIRDGNFGINNWARHSVWPPETGQPTPRVPSDHEGVPVPSVIGADELMRSMASADARACLSQLDTMCGSALEAACGGARRLPPGVTNLTLMAVHSLARQKYEQRLSANLSQEGDSAPSADLSRGEFETLVENILSQAFQRGVKSATMPFKGELHVPITPRELATLSGYTDKAGQGVRSGDCVIYVFDKSSATGGPVVGVYINNVAFYHASRMMKV